MAIGYGRQRSRKINSGDSAELRNNSPLKKMNYNILMHRKKNQIQYLITQQYYCLQMFVKMDSYCLPCPISLYAGEPIVYSTTGSIH
jgi:hypothetical protein